MSGSCSRRLPRPGYLPLVLLVVLLELPEPEVEVPLSVLELLVLELLGELSEPVLELELPVPEFDESPVEVPLEPEPELLSVFELPFVLEPELLLELELPEFEGVPESLVVESVLPLVVPELESLFSVDSDSVDLSDLAVSWGFSVLV